MKKASINKFTQGFTLIELLVVIAIIGILATIVLTSLGNARNKANDAKVSGQLSSMRAAAESYYSSNGNSYSVTSGTACNTSGSVFADSTSGMSSLIAATGLAAGGTAPTYSTKMYCQSTSSAWVVQALLPSGAGYFCVDSLGTAKQASSTTLVISGTVCP